MGLSATWTAACGSAAVRGRPGQASNPASAARQLATPEPGGVVLEWTVALAGDPELVHLHLQAVVAPGAFLVPWLEGVTLRPCEIVVRQEREVVQRTTLQYDDAGLLLARTVDDRRTKVDRDARARIVRGRGFRYEWEGERLVRLVEGNGAQARTHALKYNAEGRLVGIETTVDDDAYRSHELSYDDRDLLAKRAWSQPNGAHAESYYTYDGDGRLVRVDVDSTDADGHRRVAPALLMEYDERRLTEFGRSTITYDVQGRVAAVTSEQGAHAEYRYVCGDSLSAAQ